MPWSLYLALKQLFPSGKRFPFFTVISMLGVTLGVWCLIVSIGVMGGFHREIRRMIVDTQGDVQIRAGAYLDNVDEVISVLEAQPDVVGVTPFAEGVVMMEHEFKPAFPALQGIDIDRVNSVVPLDSYVRSGSLEDLDDDSVILSSKLAYGIGARIGSVVEVYSPLLLEKMKDGEMMLPRELEVVGIFEIGHQSLDSSVVLVTLRRMQELYGLEEGVHGFNVKLAPDTDPDIAARGMNVALADIAPGAFARSWMDSNQDFLFVVQLEKNMIFFLLLFIIVVAAFSVTSSLLISVVRKTREIGLLSAMGGRARDVALCFCWQALIIGTSGTLVGVGLGFTVLHYRNDIIGLFTRLTGSEEALLRFYEFANLPAYLSPQDLTLIISLAITISTLAGLLPAWRAARLQPVEALRSE
ncbi:ABC transporter permease [Synoicihabitans lomoniglobus]|uniref:ABC transporter permease n=1 Tax=Synoicihabitans lomoniglobus TaxID=2909285 RepID=A0AAF0CG13_9BACT|nr:ABC transporter permease [Opitutaceae bacterium LMO-M01]WED63062.1 ABC transporter permease [Opitutaceae bacterium LMO-M01]